MLILKVTSYFYFQKSQMLLLTTFYFCFNKNGLTPLVKPFQCFSARYSAAIGNGLTFFHDSSEFDFVTGFISFKEVNTTINLIAV